MSKPNVLLIDPDEAEQVADLKIGTLLASGDEPTYLVAIFTGVDGTQLHMILDCEEADSLIAKLKRETARTFDLHGNSARN